MNLFQRVNITASLAVVGAVGVTYSGAIASLGQEQSLFEAAKANVNPLLLTLFVMLFKIKTMLDDHKHFGEKRQQKGGARYIAFLLALLSWFFWIVGAYFVFKTSRAAELMILSIAISTVWVLVHLGELISEGRHLSELATSFMRERWALFNMGYIVVLGIFLGWIAPVVPHETTTSLVVLLGLLLFDYILSESYPVDDID